ncbi:MAG: hypothetical protein U1F53_04640 [Burkholderiaceae bacterium]
MTTPMLFSVGLPGGRWQQLARSLLGDGRSDEFDAPLARWLDKALDASAIGKGDPPNGAGLEHLALDALSTSALNGRTGGRTLAWSGDARLCWAASALAEAVEEARFVVWVEPPESVLALCLAGPDSGSELTGQGAWLSSALQGMGKLVQRHPGRCVVLALDEVLAHPAAFAQALSRWLPADLQLKDMPKLASPDPLAVTLAERWTTQDAGLRRTYERLHASCLPLTDPVPAFPAKPDFAGALRAFGELRRKAEQARRDDEERTKLRAELVASRRENELLQVQMHQVQEEAEHHFLAYRELEARAPDAAGPVRIGRIDVGVARDEAPHRELSLELHGLVAPDRRRDRLQARLVEHHGRPGIVLFQSPPSEPPLMGWQPEGEEDGRSFTVLIPTDVPSRQRLMRLGTGDWQLVQGLAQSLAARLTGVASLNGTRWPAVAQRFAEQLMELPSRLRFDAVDVAPDGAATGVVLVRLRQAIFGPRQLGELAMRWSPADASRPLQLLLEPAGSAAKPALNAWKMDEAGRWEAGWEVPLAGAPANHLRAAWLALDSADRALLLAIIDALPAAASAAQGRGLGVGATPANAGQLLRTAQRLVHGSRLRRTWQALRGRHAEN